MTMTSQPRLRIGLDFDDTLMYTREALLKVFNAHHGTNVLLEECLEYDLCIPWSITETDFARLFEAHEAIIHEQPPLEGMLSTLEAWRDHADFVIITGRPTSWLPSAEAWMKLHGIHFESIICARENGGKGKAARNAGVQFFIEDHGPFALDVANAGLPVLLIDRTYNRDLAHSLVTRVRDWREIRDVVAARWNLHPNKEQS